MVGGLIERKPKKEENDHRNRAERKRVKNTNLTNINNKKKREREEKTNNNSIEKKDGKSPDHITKENIEERKDPYCITEQLS